MMRMLAVGGVAAAGVLLSGCATITRGPCTLRMKRKSEFAVTVSKEGYQTQEAHVHGIVKGGGAAGVAGNVLLGGLIGAAIDGSNGSMMNLKPNPLQVTLVPVGAAAAAVAPAPVAPSQAAPAAEQPQTGGGN